MRSRSALANRAASVAVVLSLGCDGTDRVAQEGHSGDADIYLDWQIVPIWTIGGAGDTDVILSRLNADQISTDTGGNLYILDAAGRRIVVVDSTGRVVRTIGRGGSGPGEMERPVAIDVVDDGTINVYDAGKGRVVRWTAAGEPLEEFPLDARFWNRRLRTSRNGHVLFTAFRSRADTRADLRLVAQGPDGTTHELESLLTVPAVQTQHPSCPRFQPLAKPAFSTALVWDGFDGRAAVVTDASYEIDVIDVRADTMVRRIARDLPPTPLSREEALEELATLPGLGEGFLAIPSLNCRISLGELLDGRGFAEALPAVSDLRFGPDGYLWVKHNRVGADDRVDVFDPAGDFVGTLPPGSPFPAAIAPRSAFFAVDDDSLGVPVVTRYLMEGR